MTFSHEIDKYFGGSAYRYFIFLRTYSRWLDSEGRRETWEEVVNRYINFMREKIKNNLTEEEYSEIQKSILYQEVMPSMRLLWSAGEACKKNNATAYNCWFCAIDKLERFGEVLFLLCSGGGVGYSVENEIVSKLPTISELVSKNNVKYTIGDSREGWADALNFGIKQWYNGVDVDFDFSLIRPEGSRLKTFGGRSAGPKPLDNLLKFTKDIIINARGRKLKPIEVHDIVTKIGEIVVAGGSRRSAQISLSDLNDNEMRYAKVGEFWNKHPQRAMANNSAVYNEKPTQKEFLKEWFALMESNTGERGIYNRNGILKQIPARRRKLNYQGIFGGNPCMEIILRSCQACNLTSVVGRAEDTEETLFNKVRIATILGTYQSMLTDFIYLSDDWKKNCDEERLLGVSLNGQFDCPLIRKYTVLRNLKRIAINTNKKYAKKFGINISTAITCTKPEGTCSQMLNCSSGAHPRFSKYYLRRIRISSYDPLFKLLVDCGIKYYPEIGQDEKTSNTFVVEFPIKSPDNSITRQDVNAIEQLKHWKKVKIHYAEHTVSSTIYIGEDEWLDVGEWLHKNWDIVGGLSFLPRDNGVYKLAPYDEITEEQYNKYIKEFPEIMFDLLTHYENDDQTTGSLAPACESGVCQIDAMPEISVA